MSVGGPPSAQVKLQNTVKRDDVTDTEYMPWGYWLYGERKGTGKRARERDKREDRKKSETEAREGLGLVHQLYCRV